MRWKGELGTAPRFFPFCRRMDVLSIEMGKSVVGGIFRGIGRVRFCHRCPDVPETLRGGAQLAAEHRGQLEVRGCGQIADSHSIVASMWAKV